MKSEPIESHVTVKDRILEVTIELLQQENDLANVSMRRIAEAASVAVSMVNYHYQTKDNLIALAVQRFIGKVISASATNPADPGILEHLRSATEFLVTHPGISRISILRDMHDPGATDNTAQISELVRRQLAAGASETKNSGESAEEIAIRAAIQVAAIQHLFLRRAVFRVVSGLDFDVPEQRERILQRVVAITTGGENDEDSNDSRKPER